MTEKEQAINKRNENIKNNSEKDDDDDDDSNKSAIKIRRSKSYERFREIGRALSARHRNFKKVV